MVAVRFVKKQRVCNEVGNYMLVFRPLSRDEGHSKRRNLEEEKRGKKGGWGWK